MHFCKLSHYIFADFCLLDVAAIRKVRFIQFCIFYYIDGVKTKKLLRKIENTYLIVVLKSLYGYFSESTVIRRVFYKVSLIKAF